MDNTCILRQGISEEDSNRLKREDTRKEIVGISRSRGKWKKEDVLLLRASIIGLKLLMVHNLETNPQSNFS
jgi:hypothetical protein